MADTVQTPPLPAPPLFRRLKGRLLSPWSIVIGAPLAVLLLDQPRTVDVVTFAIKAFAGTAPYIAVAVLLIAWLKAAGAESTIGRAFKGHETQAIVLAALFGGLAPFCSCEVIPFIAGLLAVGAPLSAIMAFWLSSPLIDPPTVLITAGALGWSFAVGKMVFAVALGSVRRLRGQADAGRRSVRGPGQICVVRRLRLPPVALQGNAALAVLD